MILPDVLTIEGTLYYRHPGIPLSQEAKELLSDLYGVLWMEAFYDPSNEITKAWARRHVGKMKRLNEILGFKA